MAILITGTFAPSAGPDAFDIVDWHDVASHNWTATAAPTVNDDVNSTPIAYVVGSLWFDTTADKSYTCLDNTDGAAVWKEVTTPDTITVNNYIHQDSLYDNGNSGASKTITFSNGNYQKLTLTADCTLTFASPATASFTLLLKQDATGSRTVTWPVAVKWAGGSAPTLTTAASSKDAVVFVYDIIDSVYYGQPALDFK